MWFGVAMAGVAFVYLLVAGPKRAKVIEADTEIVAESIAV